VGLFLVGQSFLVMRLVSVSGESGIYPGHSMVKQHGVLLMGFKIKTRHRIRNQPEASFWICFIVGYGGGPDCDSDGRRWR
jgi:hypothetical protein